MTKPTTASRRDSFVLRPKRRYLSKCSEAGILICDGWTSGPPLIRALMIYRWIGRYILLPVAVCRISLPRLVRHGELH